MDHQDDPRRDPHYLPWEAFMDEEPLIICPICGQSHHNVADHECPDPREDD